MARQFDTITQTLSTAVADAGTYTASYPTDRDSGSYGVLGHKLAVSGALLSSPADFTLTFGASSITVTNASGAEWPASEVHLELQRAGDADDTLDTDDSRTMALEEVNLGAPDAADPDGVCEAQSGAAGALSLDGALVVDGVAIFDVPRNVVIDSGGADTAVLTITGTDQYGVAMTENITLNGTTAVAGKKAFKTVTSVVSGATISNGAFVGTGDVLGLPFFLAAAGHVLKELEDGAAPTAGTVVAGVTTEATATTGDVRGTYDPNSACDGSAAFDLLIATTDPSNLGVAQA